MAISHLLENFDSRLRSTDAPRLVSEDDWEDNRLAGFEQGYSAGWEDATTAQAKDQTRVTGALAGSLEDISFSYHEALAQMTGALEPMFRSVVDVVLPQAMALSFGHHIVEQLQGMAAEQIAQPVVLVVPPGSGLAIRSVLDRDFAMPVEMHEDPGLDPGRAFIRLGSSEREIDCQRLISTIGAAVEAFTYQDNEVTLNG